MRSKRGFTLVELIVAVSIMSIIVILAIPSIGAIQKRNALKRYENYGETVLTSGKLYTDSNEIDMFGYDSDGCYDISFEKMFYKKLLKDIDYKDVTCADNETKKTFVRVKKLDGNIRYQLSIRCIDGSNKEVYYEPIKNPICAGEKSHEGPKVVVSPKNTSGVYKSENESYKVSITVKDDDGLLENNELQYSWCKTANCSDVTSYTTLRFENKRDVKSASKKIKRPKGDGVYYLKIHPTVVVDVFNNATHDDAIYGPYNFDTTPPIVIVNAYVNGTQTKVTAAVISSRKVKGKEDNLIAYQTGNINYNDYQKLYSNKWANKANFPSGIYYEVTYKDDDAYKLGVKGSGIKSIVWKENESDKTTGGEVKGNTKLPINANGKSGAALNKDGHRKGQITVTDNAGNYVVVNVEAYIDLTLPGCKSSGGKDEWINAASNPGYRTVTGTCSDAMSGCVDKTVKYDYKDDINTTTAGPQKNVKDYAGNENSCPNDQIVKIDKTAPTCTSNANYTSKSAKGWLNASDKNGKVTVSATCSDPGAYASGCKSVPNSLVYSTDMNEKISPGTVYDNANNSTKCGEVAVKIDKTKPTISLTRRKYSSYTSGSGCSGRDMGAYPNNTWTNDQCVKVTASFEDNLSGIDTKVYSRTGFSEDKTNVSVSNPHSVSKRKESSSTITYNITDKAGNSASATAKVKLDRTKPTCSISDARAGTYSVAFKVNCSDSGGSHLTNCAGASYSDKKNSKSVNKDENSSKTFYVNDAAGNSNSCSVTIYHNANPVCGSYDCSESYSMTDTNGCPEVACACYECKDGYNLSYNYDNPMCYMTCTKPKTCNYTCYHT